MPEGLRVLVLEPNPDILDVLEMDLQDLGFRPTSATTVAEALGRLDAQAVDIVMADLQHPGSDGLYLLEELQRKNAQCPFIGTFVSTSRSQATSALHQGAFEVLEKPLHAWELARVLRDAGRVAQQRSPADVTATGPDSSLGLSSE